MKPYSLLDFAKWIVEQGFIDTSEYMRNYDLFALDYGDLPGFLVEGYIRAADGVTE